MLRKAIRYTSLLLPLLATACAQVVAVKASYNPDDYQAYKAAGSNSIDGQGFLTQLGGGVVTCAGHPVFLTPDTPYFREIVSIAVHGNHPQFPHGSGGPEDVVRHTVCDAQGNFSFSELPDGKYIVMTEVTWEAAYAQQGGPVWRAGTLDGGQRKKVILSNENLKREPN